MILLKNCFHQCIFNITSNCYLQKVQNFEYIDFSWCISTKFCKKGQFLDLQCLLRRLDEYQKESQVDSSLYPKSQSLFNYHHLFDFCRLSSHFKT